MLESSAIRLPERSWSYRRSPATARDGHFHANLHTGLLRGLLQQSRLPSSESTFAVTISPALVLDLAVLASNHSRETACSNLLVSILMGTRRCSPS